MNSTLHTICKQTLQFQYNGNADGFALQKEVSDWCNFTLIPEIEQQLDLLDLGENYFTIEKLEIEATSDKNNWQQKIRDELIFSLKQKLSFSKTKFSENDGDKSKPKKYQEEDIIESVTKARKLDELILYYFANGYLPWWGKALIQADFEAVLQNWICEEMSPEHSKYVSDKLKQTVNNSQIKRIINLVPQELIFTLLKNVYKQDTEIISQTESFFKELLVNKISPEKEKIIAKEVYSFLLMMMFESEGIINVDLMMQFLFNELSRMKGFEKTVNQSFVKTLGEANPVKSAWVQYLACKKKVVNDLKQNGNGIKELENQIKVQLQKEIEVTDISEKEKIIQYNKLIDKLTNPDFADKSNEAQAAELQEGIYIDNAGAVIFAAFIPALFKQLELEKNGAIQNPDLAALIIQYCVTGNAKIADYELVLPKILCGIAIDFPINTNTQIAAGQMKEVDEMLTSLIMHWSVLKNTSVEGLRESFFKRNGKLSMLNNEWLLQVEQRPYDILLQQMPWSISMIRLPWMNNLLKTEWV